MQGLHKLLLLYVLTGLGQNGHGISGGEIVPKSKMQYMVSLQDGHGKHLCGGFLVSENVLITSASCDKRDPKVVYYGYHNLEEKIKPVNIEKKCKSSDSDIMLLKLRKNVKGDNVKPTEIPNSEIDLKVNQQCVVAGWGPEDCEEGPVKELRMVTVSVFNCPHNATNICTSETGFCEIDTGGPLVCDEKAVGVVKKNNSTTFANISTKHVWIKDKINNPSWKDCCYTWHHLKAMEMSFVLLLFAVLTGADGTHIVGGRDAPPHSRPYMASLQIQNQHNCGGALVREDFVLTAAHCQIRGPYTVVLGVDSLSADEPTKQVFSSIRSIPHPRYNGHANDIMLLKLNGSAQLTETVQLVSLKAGRVRPVNSCITVGWGDIGDNNTLPLTLQEVNVTILSQQTCRSRWGMVPITGSMVCGVGAGVFQGFCSGDSGGPLVCDGATAGVVSFSGRRCGDPRTPDVYTRISSFTPWITTVLNNN
ncbi:serine protease 57-like [Betta splendens]|uniref:trypsin n=1 Tax=Betta splendens TaxID=158456 RepID=A0A8M1HCP8_BETSP|nr:serine protease 57-like [Betta splendens]